MAIYCVVFELQRAREEYRQFLKHLDSQQQVSICENCRLVYSHNSAESLQTYLENFIYAGDTLFVGEISSKWVLNKNFEATEWLRELQFLSEHRQAMLGSDRVERTHSN
jgi:hypothetical protein